MTEDCNCNEFRDLIHFDQDCFQILAKRYSEFVSRGAMLCTDSNVYRLYQEQIHAAVPDIQIYVIPSGEKYKTEKTLFSLLKEMADCSLKRNSVLLALGGGVVLDLAGLAASLYMRGIDCIFFPTTLLAQADAAIGGKTAINFLGIKNLIGTFSFPKEVVFDPQFLTTLPRRELRCGLGEIVKCGALSAPIFQKLTQNQGRLFDLSVLSRLIPECVSLKRDIVQQDPYETGLRKALNLGHTTAHALETERIFSHGECVLYGLVYEAEIANWHLVCDRAFLSQLKELCFAALGKRKLISLQDKTIEKVMYDKKNMSAEKVVLTVPTALEQYALLELTFDQYKKDLREAEQC